MAITAGIDTWSVGWYLDEDSPGDRAAQALAAYSQARADWLADPIEGHRIGYYPGSRFLIAEGHPGDGLTAPSPEALSDVAERIRSSLGDYGVPVPRGRSRGGSWPDSVVPEGRPGFAGIRRLDLAVDVERPPDVGAAMLRGIASVLPPLRFKAVTVREAAFGAVETVSWMGARGKVARAYDKGIESGSHRRGSRIRLEDQRRFPAGRRPTLESMTPGHARSYFTRRFEPILAATEGVKVAGISDAVDYIEEAVMEGRISASQGKTVIGHLVLASRGVTVGNRQTNWRHRKLVQRVGLVLIDDASDVGVEVNLSDELGEYLEATFEDDGCNLLARAGAPDSTTPTEE